MTPASLGMSSADLGRLGYKLMVDAITPLLAMHLLDHRTERTVQEHYNLADSLSASSRYLERLGARRRLALDGNSKRG
jgi:hypothetical protein